VALNIETIDGDLRIVQGLPVGAFDVTFERRDLRVRSEGAKQEPYSRQSRVANLHKTSN
jgi:hypothetical protein